MMSLRVIPRAVSILRVCHHWRLDQDELHPRLQWLSWLAALLFFWQERCTPALPVAARVKNALIELGPIFIKFGQMLSTRRDLLPLELANHLAELQDQVPPFASDQAIAEIEKAWAKPLSQCLQFFDPVCLASASVAQVHAARLLDGREVVVKIIRPGIHRQISADLQLMQVIAKFLEYLHADGLRLRPREVVHDYEHTLLNELDLRIEAANTAALRRNFEDGSLLYVPQIHFDWVRENVMVAERIHGIPIGDSAALQAAAVNHKVLAERGVKIFFTQVFRDRFFHADMHPGNIFVDASNPELPRYIGIDCAIIGTLSESDQHYLAENFLAFFNRDYRRIAELHVESGWVPADVRVEDFESAIRANCEPIFGKPLAQISFGLFLLGLFQTARRFRMTVQPQLVLLQKTLFYVEGLGRQLYPELDLWQTAKPFLDQWAKDRVSPRHLWQRLQKHLPGLIQDLPDLPFKLQQIVNAQAQTREMTPQWQALRTGMRREARRARAQTRILFGIVLLAASTLLLAPTWTLSLYGWLFWSTISLGLVIHGIRSYINAATR